MHEGFADGGGVGDVAFDCGEVLFYGGGSDVVGGEEVVELGG